MTECTFITAQVDGCNFKHILANSVIFETNFSKHYPILDQQSVSTIISKRIKFYPFQVHSQMNQGGGAGVTDLQSVGMHEVALF